MNGVVYKCITRYNAIVKQSRLWHLLWRDDLEQVFIAPKVSEHKFVRPVVSTDTYNIEKRMHGELRLQDTSVGFIV